MTRSKWEHSDHTDDLTNDRSLLKTILVEGDGDTAGRGAKVTLKYSLRLSDEREAHVFDSSSPRKDGVLSFTLGRRKVIPALELVAHSMKLGEKCSVKAAAPYAFGSKGLKRKGVPPNATVYMDVELLHFEHAQKQKPFPEMTPSERFDMAKKCKEEGNALFKEFKYDRAMAQYSQCIQYLANVFYKENTPVEQPQSRSELPQHNRRAPLTNGSPTPEHQTVLSSEQQSQPEEHGFEEAQIEEHDGEQSPNGVMPSNAAPTHAQQPTSSAHPVSQLSHEREVVETVDVSTATQHEQNASEPSLLATENGTSEASSSGALENHSEQQTQTKSEPQAHSEVATPADHQNTYSGAANDEGAPSQAQHALEEHAAQGPSQAEVSALHVTTLNNLSLCLLKMEQFKKAVESASLALRADPKSFKALYYRGRALGALGEWEKAREDLVAAFNLQRNNMGIRMEIQKLDRKRKQFEEKEKRQAAAMFA